MSKRTPTDTAATIREPERQEQADPAMDRARRDLALAEQGVEAAARLVAEAQEAAIPAALRWRDAAYLRDLAVLPVDAPDLHGAEAGYRDARVSLDRARTALRHAEREREHAADMLAGHEAAADRARRRSWAEEQHADVSLQLLGFRQQEAALLANPYVRDSFRGREDLGDIRQRIVALEAALERAATRAPAAE